MTGYIVYKRGEGEYYGPGGLPVICNAREAADLPDGTPFWLAGPPDQHDFSYKGRCPCGALLFIHGNDAPHPLPTYHGIPVLWGVNSLNDQGLLDPPGTPISPEWDWAADPEPVSPQQFAEAMAKAREKGLLPDDRVFDYNSIRNAVGKRPQGEFTVSTLSPEAMRAAVLKTIEKLRNEPVHMRVCGVTEPHLTHPQGEICVNCGARVPPRA